MYIDYVHGMFAFTTELVGTVTAAVGYVGYRLKWKNIARSAPYVKALSRATVHCLVLGRAPAGFTEMEGRIGTLLFPFTFALRCFLEALFRAVHFGVPFTW